MYALETTTLVAERQFLMNRYHFFQWGIAAVWKFWDRPCSPKCVELRHETLLSESFMIQVFFCQLRLGVPNLKCCDYCMYSPKYLHMICIVCLLIFITNTCTHTHTCYVHKARLANLVLQDCTVNSNNKVKLLMCFHIFALVLGGRQHDGRWNVLTINNKVHDLRLSPQRSWELCSSG